MTLNLCPALLFEKQSHYKTLVTLELAIDQVDPEFRDPLWPPSSEMKGLCQHTQPPQELL